jgi:hypothetical protein
MYISDLQAETLGWLHGPKRKTNFYLIICFWWSELALRYSVHIWEHQTGLEKTNKAIETKKFLRQKVWMSCIHYDSEHTIIRFSPLSSNVKAWCDVRGVA